MQPRAEYVNQERLQYEVNKLLSRKDKTETVQAKMGKRDFVIKTLFDREAYIDWIREEYAFEEDFELV